MNLHNVKEVLDLYKSVTCYYPNWFFDYKQTTNNDDINTTNFDVYNVNFVNNFLYDIEFFIMTRTIKEEYNTLPNYEPTLTPIFYKALCHMGDIIKFDNIISNKLTNMYFSCLNIFILLSRVKTEEEFRNGFCKNYYFNTHISIDNNHKNIPIWIYEKYKDVDMPYILYKNKQLSQIHILKKIGDKEIYTKLYNMFNVDIITLRVI